LLVLNTIVGHAGDPGISRRLHDLAPRDVAAALELGYHAGNSHWTVRFDGSVMRIALEGPEQSYLDRLAALFDTHRVTKVNGDVLLVNANR
jgi:urease accessory protein UreE